MAGICICLRRQYVAPRSAQDRDISIDLYTDICVNKLHEATCISLFRVKIRISFFHQGVCTRCDGFFTGGANKSFRKTTGGQRGNQYYCCHVSYSTEEACIINSL